MTQTYGTGRAAGAEAFHRLHHDKAPLLLVNVWDVTSARLAVAAGAAAVGTTSFGIALAHGVPDAELVPFDDVLAIVAGIVEAVDVPVTLDLEAGRGLTPAAVGAAVRSAIDVGAAGVNIEDSVPGERGHLRPPDEQAMRLAAARSAADEAGIPLFLNARCDTFFGAPLDDDEKLDQTLQRAEIYERAGADGIFVPGLGDLGIMATIVAATQLPVNVMTGPTLPPLPALTTAGVRRISQGASTFLAVAGFTKAEMARFLEGNIEPSADWFAAGIAAMTELVR